MHGVRLAKKQQGNVFTALLIVGLIHFSEVTRMISSEMIKDLI